MWVLGYFDQRKKKWNLKESVLLLLLVMFESDFGMAVCFHFLLSWFISFIFVAVFFPTYRYSFVGYSLFCFGIKLKNLSHQSIIALALIVGLIFFVPSNYKKREAFPFLLSFALTFLFWTITAKIRYCPYISWSFISAKQVIILLLQSFAEVFFSRKNVHANQLRWIQSNNLCNPIVKFFFDKIISKR